MQIRSTKVFYFEKYFENTILFCIFKIQILLSEYFILYFQNSFRSILHITVSNAVSYYHTYAVVLLLTFMIIFTLILSLKNFDLIN